MLVGCLRLLAVAAAVMTTAASFTFGPGHTSLVAPVHRVLPPYGVAAVSATVWTHTRRPLAAGGHDGSTWRRSGSAAEQEGPTT